MWKECIGLYLFRQGAKDVARRGNSGGNLRAERTAPELGTRSRVRKAPSTGISRCCAAFLCVWKWILPPGIEVEGIQGPIDCQTDSGGVRATNIGSDVHARTDSGGIHIRKANGEVRAHADSGGIEALEVAGRIEVETDSGGIRISQTQPASIHARADSGGADIALAATGGYDITARSDNGRVTADNVAPTQTPSRKSLDGRLRGGGPLVDVRVDSGSVVIH
jgi:hypothetical protein